MKRIPVLFFLILCLGGGIVFTWPMAAHFFSAIPYTLKPIEGYERVPLLPGDHLQAYYWYWLLWDNLFGPSPWFTNPYEFNGPHGPMGTVYAFFPYSLCYLLLRPLGPLGAYNGLILLSFLLCGGAMFLLARKWTEDYWAAVLAGLIFAVFPYRVSHIAGGQLTGHIIFFLPGCLYFLEQVMATGRLRFGIAAACCIFLPSVMDPHTSYLMALTLAFYLPFRFFLFELVPIKRERKDTVFAPGILGVLSAGVSWAFFLWMKYGRGDRSLFLDSGFFQTLVLCLLGVILFWLFLTALTYRWTTLSYAEARNRTGKIFFCFLPLLFYGLRAFLKIPHLGLLLSSSSLLFFGITLGRILWPNRDRLPFFDRRGLVTVAAFLAAGYAPAAVFLLHLKKTVIAPSVAGKGRTLGEVLLFSPYPANLFFWQDINREKFIYLGWGLLTLAVLGAARLLRKEPQDPGKTALAGLLAFLGLVLCLGPRLEGFPLYQFLYQHLPFFNYSRVPGRFLFVAMTFLTLLAAQALAALRNGLAARGWIRLGKGIPFLIILMVVSEYHSRLPLGITDLPTSGPVYETIKSALPAGKRVLELPLWPGDSHQSSVYEYTVTRTQKPMINGYAPVVTKQYIEEVFWPLFPLDFGEGNDDRIRKLGELKVGMITFHDRLLVYPEKISPFPARLALKRLEALPFVKKIAEDHSIHLFWVDPSAPSRSGRNPEEITSPVSAIYPANYLQQETGRKETDPNAFGYYLMMDEIELRQGKLVPLPRAQGNVAVAVPEKDQPGYFVISHHRFFPSGNYQARFRIQRGPSATEEEIGRIEIYKDRNILLNRVVLRGERKGSASWEEIPVAFQLRNLSEIGFRIYFNGQAGIRFNTAVISFADQPKGPGTVEAEDLLRQTGDPVKDPLASGGEAVWGKKGFHPPPVSHLRPLPDL